MVGACADPIFQFFVADVFEGDGEISQRLLRVDRSIDTTSFSYKMFLIYAIGMILVFPLGVPIYFWLILTRNRHELRELRRIELTQEANFKLALLQASGSASAQRRDELHARAEKEYNEASDRFDALRDKLPTVVRKLTAGYELRTYWFEIFECARKILLVGLPVFCPPGCKSCAESQTPAVYCVPSLTD